MTPAMVNRIFFAFSAEKDTLLPFFGYWTSDNFVSFVDQFRNATQGTDATKTIYQDSAGNGIAMPMNNFAIYDLKQACNQWNMTARWIHQISLAFCCSGARRAETLTLITVAKLMEPILDLR